MQLCSQITLADDQEFSLPSEDFEHTTYPDNKQYQAYDDESEEDQTESDDELPSSDYQFDITEN
ncbi:hypothetical protein EOPP23_16090 [Endozoicomonas sp. OPT23]|nr:hypothetical protein [Endozoicomonas sp. OPT23]